MLEAATKGVVGQRPAPSASHGSDGIAEAGRPDLADILEHGRRPENVHAACHTVDSAAAGVPGRVRNTDKRARASHVAHAEQTQRDCRAAPGEGDARCAFEKQTQCRKRKPSDARAALVSSTERPRHRSACHMGEGIPSGSSGSAACQNTRSGLTRSLMEHGWGAAGEPGAETDNKAAGCSLAIRLPVPSPRVSTRPAKTETEARPTRRESVDGMVGSGGEWRGGGNMPVAVQSGVTRRAATPPATAAIKRARAVEEVETAGTEIRMPPGTRTASETAPSGTACGGTASSASASGKAVAMGGSVPKTIGGRVRITKDDRATTSDATPSLHVLTSVIAAG